MMQLKALLPRIPACALGVGLSTLMTLPTAQAFPGAPQDPNHPGSKIYSYQIKTMKVTCQGRQVEMVHPVATSADESFPVVIYGHGQALGFDNYKATFDHLAGKGVIAVHPAYDKGFFDTEWTRMGRDYVNVSACALDQLKAQGIQAELSQVTFAGHSKGAYVASVAAGLATAEGLRLRPAAVILFQMAGLDAKSWASLPETLPLTVVYSDQDSIVKRSISEDAYRLAKSRVKQFLVVRSYANASPKIEANHFWPLTKGSFAGGGPETALHYYSGWKWLVAVSLDLALGTENTNPYVYGPLTVDKGVADVTDEIVARSF